MIENWFDLQQFYWIKISYTLLDLYKKIDSCLSDFNMIGWITKIAKIIYISMSMSISIYITLRAQWPINLKIWFIIRQLEEFIRKLQFTKQYSNFIFTSASLNWQRRSSTGDCHSTSQYFLSIVHQYF